MAGSSGLTISHLPGFRNEPGQVLFGGLADWFLATINSSFQFTVIFGAREECVARLAPQPSEAQRMIAQLARIDESLRKLTTTPAPPTHEALKAKADTYCQKRGMSLEVFAKDVLRVGRSSYYYWRNNPDSVPCLKARIERIINELV